MYYYNGIHIILIEGCGLLYHQPEIGGWVFIVCCSRGSIGLD